VDTVGAGDSFTSGLLDGLRRADLIGGPRRQALAAIDESSLISVLDTASLIAAITCSRPGADPPTREELDAAQAAASGSAAAKRPAGRTTTAPSPPRPVPTVPSNASLDPRRTP
jgi:fructokinase